LKKGWKDVPELVFCTEAGEHLDTDNLRKRVFYKCLEKAGLRRIRFHDLRHTYASLLLAEKESPAYVQQQLGHASIQLTVDTYGHLVPGSNRSAVDKLDDVSTHPAAPPAHPENKKGLASSANPLISLVAGTGFEPVTFGL
jgi:integrase